MASEARKGSIIAAGACALAAAYGLAVVFPPLMPVVVVAAVLAACALAPRAPRLKVALGVLAAWLALAFGAALLWRDAPRTGFALVLLAVFLLPLPLAPWLYARTFAARRDGEDA